MLDKRDKIIFENLLHDCRISDTRLAKLTRLKQPSVHYRIKQLEKKNYIDKYDIILDYTFFNLSTEFHFISVPKEKSEEFEENVKKNKGAIALISLVHKKNYCVMTMMNSDEKKRFENYLKRKKYKKVSYKIRQLEIIPYSIFDVPVEENKIEINKKKIKLDEKDIKILKELMDGGARKPLLEITEKTKLTWDIVRHRFMKMKKSGLIAMFIAQPGMERFSIQNDFLIIRANTDFDSLAKKLGSLKKFSYLCQLTNNIYITQILSLDFEEYKETLNKLYSLLNSDLKSSDIYNTKKVIFSNRYDFKNILKNQK